MCKRDIEFADKLTDLKHSHEKALAVTGFMMEHPHLELLTFIVHDYLHEMGQTIETLHRSAHDWTTRRG